MKKRRKAKKKKRRREKKRKKETIFSLFFIFTGAKGEERRRIKPEEIRVASIPSLSHLAEESSGVTTKKVLNSNDIPNGMTCYMRDTDF